MKDKMMWAYLIHLGYNMWGDKFSTSKVEYVVEGDTLLCEKDVWDEVCESLAKGGCNTLVIDIGEGVKFDSHPEIAIKNAWSKSELEAELKKLRSMGIEPIPKLNFSACHDAWLGEYAYMVSSPTYYKVCADLIAETCELFDTPSFFHIGMDEETIQHQRHFSYAVVRQGELWWNDLNFYAQQVQKAGVRPWMWSDAIWHHQEEYLKRVSKDILQSNWYYNDFAEGDETYIQAYDLLEQHGYDQVPTGSTFFASQQNMEKTVINLQDKIDPERLYGFMQTPWRPTTRKRIYQLLASASALTDAINVYKK